MNFKALFLSSLILMAIGQTVVIKTIYVDDNAADTNDGSSWTNAYNYLQDALVDANSAEKPAEIKVAQDVYKPDQGKGEVPYDQKATFKLIYGVMLKGGFAGSEKSNPNARDVNLYETVLSGDLKGNDVVVKYTRDLLDESSLNDNSYCVVICNMVPETAVLDGFTTMAGSHHGMCNKNSNPTISNCTFTNNLADSKGGVIHNTHYSNLILTNSILWHNAPDEHEIVNYAKSSSTVSYCNVQDGSGQLWFVEGCIDADPLFASPDHLQLLPDSPCIDSGDYQAVPFEIKTDFNHNQYSISNTVNMGALEVKSSSAPRLLRQIKARER